MRIARWDDEQFGPLTEEAVKRRFKPSLYQVLLRDVAEPAVMTGSAPPRTLIAVEGSFLVEAEGERVLLKPGDMVEVGGGEFVFRSQTPVIYFAVYPLPPERVLN